MNKKVKVKATIIAEVWVHKDIQGNKEIEDFEDIQDTLEFEIIMRKKVTEWKIGELQKQQHLKKN